MLRLVVLSGPALALLAGCASNRACWDNTDYQQAQERPPLQMPAGVSGSERVGGTSIEIPPVAPNPDRLDPAPRCLDEPPGYFKRVQGPPPAPAPAPAPATQPDPANKG